MAMKLTAENYYSREANEAYWSASFVKEMMSCPARAMASLHGAYERPESSALLIGAYVDAAFTGDAAEQFTRDHPALWSKKTGAMKADVAKAKRMIDRASEDALFMEYMRGDKQTIKTGVIGGLPFKGKFDVYWPGKRIVDLKTVKDMEPVYAPGQGRITFAEYWNWPLQMAIYQALEGNGLPCYLAVITKQDPPDIAVIALPQHMLDAEMEVLLERLPYFDAMRSGIIEAVRCEKCAYCRSTKRLTGPIALDEMREDLYE